MAPKKAVNLPNHPFLTQDIPYPNTPQGTSDLSQGHQTSSTKLPTSKRRRIYPTASQNLEGHDLPPSSSITDHLNRRATIAHGEESYPLHRRRSEAGDTVARHLTRPAENSPMARWKRESAQEEPWNSSTSRLDAKDVVDRAREVQKRNTDLTSKDGNHVTPKATPSSRWTSSKATEYGSSEGGACADLAGVGTWLK